MRREKKKKAPNKRQGCVAALTRKKAGRGRHAVNTARREPRMKEAALAASLLKPVASTGGHYCWC